MADEKAVVSTEKVPAKAAKKKAKKDTFKWFRELKSEFKKIVWPSGKQLKNNTAVVLAMVVIMATAIALFDWGFKALLSAAITPGEGGYEYGDAVDDSANAGDKDDTADNTDGGAGSAE